MKEGCLDIGKVGRRKQGIRENKINGKVRKAWDKLIRDGKTNKGMMKKIRRKGRTKDGKGKGRRTEDREGKNEGRRNARRKRGREKEGERMKEVRKESKGVGIEEGKGRRMNDGRRHVGTEKGKEGGKKERREGGRNVPLELLERAAEPSRSLHDIFFCRAAIENQFFFLGQWTKFLVRGRPVRWGVLRVESGHKNGLIGRGVIRMRSLR